MAGCGTVEVRIACDVIRTYVSANNISLSRCLSTVSRAINTRVTSVLLQTLSRLHCRVDGVAARDIDDGCLHKSARSTGVSLDEAGVRCIHSYHFN